jgi:hypothetical protein
MITKNSVGRPKSELSLSNADRQRLFRLKQKQKKAVLIEEKSLNDQIFNPLSDLGTLSKNEIDLITMLIKDYRAPREQSLAAMYAAIVKECYRKGVSDDVVQHNKIMYMYAAKDIL